jgi:hypothetical protein
MSYITLSQNTGASSEPFELKLQLKKLICSCFWSTPCCKTMSKPSKDGGHGGNICVILNKNNFHSKSRKIYIWLQECGLVFSITLNNTIIYKSGTRKKHFNYIIGLILPLWAEKNYHILHGKVTRLNPTKDAKNLAPLFSR